MRVALVRWRAERDGDLTTFVPDVDLDQLDSWGVIDLRGSGREHQESAAGLALMVAPNHDGPIPGALIDLGDDHQTRLGTTVGRVLANRLGLNLVEATPGRIAAELLTLHARADDNSKPNPLVGERRFPRSKTDQRRRQRVWCGGVLLYDELGSLVDAEATYYAETFPTAGALTSSQDLPWDSTTSGGSFTVASGGAYAHPASAAVDSIQRMSTAHSSTDHFAEVTIQIGHQFQSLGGPCIRMETASHEFCYGWRLGGGVILLSKQTSTAGGTFTNLGSTSFSHGTSTQYVLRLEGSGSTLTGYRDGSSVLNNTDTAYTGTRAGFLGRAQPLDNTLVRVYSFATALIGEEPGGGGTLVEGEGTAALGGLTATATGTPTVVGEATATLGALTGTATGTVQGVVTGTATADLGGLTAAATGVRSTTGTAAGQLGGLTGTATGARSTTGTATADLGGLTGTATGTSQGVVTGTAAGALGGLTATATGQKVVHGTASADLGGLDGHAVGEGATTVEGTATGNLGGLTATAAGVPTTHGTATGHLGGLTAAASGTVTVLGTAAAVLGGVTATAAGDVIVIGHATAQLSALAATATGQRRVVGTAVGNLGGLTAAVNIVTADPNPLSITIRETGHQVVVRETGHRLVTKERR